MSVIPSVRIADHEKLTFACPTPYCENKTHFPPLFTAPTAQSGWQHHPDPMWAVRQEDCFQGGHGFQGKPRRLLSGNFCRNSWERDLQKDGLGCEPGDAWGPFVPPLRCGVLVNEDPEKTTTAELWRDMTWVVGDWIQLRLKLDVFFFPSKQYALDFCQLQIKES